MNNRMEHEKYMRVAIDIAESTRGLTSPNPFVGTVIVKNKKILSTGATQPAGKNHAEIEALQQTNETHGATLYVTLEPCCHHGKTPPCTDAIIQSGIERVVIGITDPNPVVAGKGIAHLKNAGIEVISGVLEKEITKQNEIFLHFIQTQTPFVCMKIAASQDGKISERFGKATKLTSHETDQWVHKLRSQYDAILVGTNTVIVDNPHLTVRHTEGKNPIRIILDKDLRIPLSAHVYKDNGAKVFVATSQESNKHTREQLQQLSYIELLNIPLDENKKLNLNTLFEVLGGKNITSVLIEGGSKLNTYCLQNHIPQKVYTISTPHTLGPDGIDMYETTINLSGFTKTSEHTINQDSILEWYPKV